MVPEPYQREEEEKRLRDGIPRANTVRNTHFNARHLYSPYGLLKCSEMNANQTLGEAAIQTHSPAVPKETEPVSLGRGKMMLNLNPTSLGNDIFNRALASKPRFPLGHIKQGARTPSPGLGK